MDPKHLTTVIVSAILGVILLVTVVAPIVSDGQTTTGDPATVTNVMNTTTPKYTIWDGSDITIEYDATDKTYSVNGVANSFASTTQRILVASNDFACRNGGSADNPQILTQYVNLTSQIAHSSFTFEVVNKEYTFTVSDVDPYTGTLDWMVYAEDTGTANLGQVNQNAGPWYTSNNDKLIVLGNIYTTGENDTFYSYYDGELTVNDEYADVSNVEVSKTLAEGYTDIYETTITVNVGEESFTPYFILTPITVTGHEASGAVYSMLGVIPIVIAIGIVLGVVGMAVVNRYE